MPSSWQHSLCTLSWTAQSRLIVDTVEVNSAITGCSKGRRWRHAAVLLKLLKNLQQQPDLLTLTLSLGTCNSADWRRAAALLQECSLDADALSVECGMLPDTVFLNTVLRTLEKGKLWQQALRTFSRWSLCNVVLFGVFSEVIYQIGIQH